MKRAIDVGLFGELADPRVVARLAARAEERGWDGFFVWDHITYRAPVRAVADPWVALAAVSPRYSESWLLPLLRRLLAGDRDVVRLLRVNPFPDNPPAVIRVRRYRYRYTTWRELRETGAWWHREPVDELVPPITLR